MILFGNSPKKYPKNATKGREVAIPLSLLNPSYANACEFASKLKKMMCRWNIRPNCNERQQRRRLCRIGVRNGGIATSLSSCGALVTL